MGRHTVAAVFFLFLIVADVSSAASKIRKLGDEAGSDIPAAKEAVPQPPNPVTGLKEPDLKVDNLGKSGNGAAILDPKASGNTGSAIAPPQSTTESGKVIDVSGKRDSANSPPKTLADSGKDKASDGSGSVETGKDKQAKKGEGKKNNDTDEKGILKDNQTKEGEGVKKKNDTDNVPEGVQINKGKGKKENGTDNGPEGVQINEGKGKGKKENEGDDKSGPKDEQKKEGDDKKKNAGDGNSGLPEKEIDKGEEKKKKGGDDKSGLPDKDKNEGHEKEKNEGGDKSGPQDEKKENQGDDKSGSEDKQVKEGDDKKKTDDISGSQDKQKKEEEAKQKNDNDDKSASQSFSSGTCSGVPRRCTDQNHLIACIKGVGSKELVVLVENEGEGTLKVKLEVSTSTEYPLKELNVPKHETKGINISATSIQNGKLILTAGHGDCVLHMDLPSSSGTFFNLPEYDKLLTPINGAYFLIATVVIFAATWACCKFRKRKRHLDGVPYQELEMGRPETISDATGIETADSWDQVWDDDWDEEHAVKSPTVRHLGSISANGLTARSANKDGWENDWDD